MVRKLNVLWATDGSQYSLTCMEMMRSIVVPVASKVHVLTVVADPRNDGVQLAGKPRTNRAVSLERGLVMAQDCSALLPESVRVEAQTQFGHPVQVILRAAQKVQADLIVVGAKGHSDLRLMRMGSVAQGVLEYAKRPVLVIRPTAKVTETAIIGIDGSRTALHALEFFERLAFEPAAVRVITRVVQMVYRRPPFPVNDERLADAVTVINDEVKRRAEQDIAAALDVLSPKSVASAINQVLVGRPDEELLKSAAQWQADIIVVGSGLPSRSRRYSIGSTAESVAREAISSVLVVRRCPLSTTGC